MIQLSGSGVAHIFVVVMLLDRHLSRRGPRGEDDRGGSGGLDGVGGVFQRTDHRQRHTGARLAERREGAARETGVGGLAGPGQTGARAVTHDQPVRTAVTTRSCEPRPLLGVQGVVGDEATT